MNLRKLLVLVVVVSSPVGFTVATIAAPNAGTVLLGLAVLGLSITGVLASLFAALITIGPLLYLTNTNTSLGFTLAM